MTGNQLAETAQKDETIENGKKAILDDIYIHSPSHASFLLTGFLPELEHEFVPPLDLKNGHWRIALHECREDIPLFRGEKPKLKVPVKIEVSINNGPAKVMDEIIPPPSFRIGAPPLYGPGRPKFHDILIEEPIERIKISAAIISDEENDAKKKEISDLPCPLESKETISSLREKYSLKRHPNRKRKPASVLDPNLAQLSEVKMKFPFILKTMGQLEIEDIDGRIKSLQSRKKSLEEIAKAISERCPKCKQELKK